MSKIHDEIDRLKQKADIIDYARGLAKLDNPFSSEFKIGSSEATKQLSDRVKEFLLKTAESLESGVISPIEDSAPSLTADEISKLKFFTSRLDKMMEGPIVKSSYIVSDFKSRPEPKIVKTQPIVDTHFPFKAVLLDTSYITDLHGPLDRTVNVTSDGQPRSLIHPDMEISIIAEQSPEYYIGQLIQTPGVTFPVPKECVEINR